MPDEQMTTNAQPERSFAETTQTAEIQTQTQNILADPVDKTVGTGEATERRTDEQGDQKEEGDQKEPEAPEEYAEFDLQRVRRSTGRA